MAETSNFVTRYWNYLPKDIIKNVCISSVGSAAGACLYLYPCPASVVLATATSGIFFSVLNTSLAPLFKKLCPDQAPLAMRFAVHFLQLSLSALTVNLFYIPALGFQIHFIFTVSINFLITAGLNVYEKNWQSRSFFVIVG
jgi:hypothetical protein